MTVLMMIMALVSSFMVAIVFGLRRYQKQGTLALDKPFIIALIIISVVIGGIISGIDVLQDMMIYHKKG